MTVCICLTYIGGGTLGPTIELTCNPSGTIINQPTSSLLPPTCPLCLTVPSGTTSITAFDPVTNCTETINVTSVPTIPCSFGMDVVFSIDYTASMGPVINKIKEQISILTNSIVTLSNNNYRLGLVIFDEFNQPINTGLPYYNSFSYQTLPAQQKYVNLNNTIGKGQSITSFELLSTNNQTSFNIQLLKLNFSQTPFLSRLNQNGILNEETAYINSFVFGTKYQVDGKIVSVGNFTNSVINNQLVSCNRIVRMTTNGNLDPSFIISTGFNNSANILDINQLGQIIVGGSFTQYQGIPMNRIALLNTNGSLDLGFTIGTGFSIAPEVVKFQPDGKILVGGGFLNYNGIPSSGICRINTDGTIDSSFIVGTGFNSTVFSLDIQTDGKIIVTGFYTMYNGVTANGICRLNTDGTIDTSFTSGTGPNNFIKSTTTQVDGKIIIGGNFTIYNGTSVNRICMLNTDGTIDSSFTVGTGFNDLVRKIKLQSTGKIIVGGEFIVYNGTQVNRICRLNTDGTLDTSFGCGTPSTIG